jgi:hypothetical protein
MVTLLILSFTIYKLSKLSQVKTPAPCIWKVQGSCPNQDTKYADIFFKVFLSQSMQMLG